MVLVNLRRKKTQVVSRFSTLFRRNRFLKKKKTNPAHWWSQLVRLEVVGQLMPLGMQQEVGPQLRQGAVGLPQAEPSGVELQTAEGVGVTARRIVSYNSMKPDQKS